jgi:DNA-binding NarL/FixJ family response regulator
VDDDPLFRTVIGTVIAKTPGFRQVGEAASGEDAIRVAASLRPELVLMDIRLPGMDGFEAASRLLQSNPAPIVVLMSADPSELRAEVDSLGVSVAVVSKGELSPRGLLELWERLATN